MLNRPSLALLDKPHPCFGPLAKGMSNDYFWPNQPF
jgi:hypothetical protein